jgi:MarR family 2-MHQ and catechol resistance regulon transcriptional repressor
VDLTDEGRSFISDLYARHARDIETVTKVLTDREQDQLRTLLKKLGLSAANASRQRTVEPNTLKPSTKKESPRRKGTRP